MFVRLLGAFGSREGFREGEAGATGGQLAKTDRLDALTASVRRLLVILDAMTKHHETRNSA
jgi:hypothetical protein